MKPFEYYLVNCGIEPQYGHELCLLAPPAWIGPVEKFYYKPMYTYWYRFYIGTAGGVLEIRRADKDSAEAQREHLITFTKNFNS